MRTIKYINHAKTSGLMKLSVIIPAYNEEKTIVELIEKVYKVKLDKEIIIVDDGSTDNTSNRIKEAMKNKKDIYFIKNEINKGKGYSIRKGLEQVKGNIVIVQDADLELDPNDYYDLIKPFEEKNTQVVYGSRLLNKDNPKQMTSFYFGARIITFFANLLYGIKITDEPVGYKLFKTEIIKNLDLKCRGFEFCPEVTAKVARKGIKIYEVPIYYYPRSIKEGKKVRFKDGLIAIWILLKYRFIN